jgi:outer membrane murein-binding lipoprotein Lpp
MVDKLHARVVQLEAKVEALEKDSHPPVDWSKAVDDAVAASRARAEDEGP